MWPGPQDSEMGELEAWTRLTTVRRLCGQVSMGPSGVPDQSLVLISLAISPPPINQSSGADNLASLVTRATLRLVGGGVPASPGALSARSEAFQLVARRVFPGGAYRPCPAPGGALCGYGCRQLSLIQSI